MGYPLIDEFCRIPGIASCRPDFFRRCQREFREVVQPQLDEREVLLFENAELKDKLAKLMAKKEKAA